MLIAIGDVHGEVWKLRKLLQMIHELPIGDDDRLVFLGDYVDRGPEVSLTIDLLIKIQQERPNTIFLRGNHDQAMMDVRQMLDPRGTRDVNFEDVSWWFSYGGQQTMSAYGGRSRWYQRVPGDHWTFLENTQIEFREGGYIFVHAGLLPPGSRWFEQDDYRMWIRDDFLDSDADFGGVVVFGHTPSKNGLPRIEPNKIGIDTGAAYGGHLTAALLTLGHPEKVRFLHA